MASIVKTKEGTWRAMVRRKGRYASRTFRLKSLADEWAIETERLIDLGREPSIPRIRDPKTIADLIDFHISDLHEAGRSVRRSKQAAMDTLKRDLGATRINRFDAAAIIKYGTQRAKKAPVSSIPRRDLTIAGRGASYLSD